MNPFVLFAHDLSKDLAGAKARLYKNSLTWLKVRYDKLDIKLTENLPYNSLAPISDADIGNDYQKALDWALKNRKEKNIRNIALTGPYGSGKSSILNTYIKNCQTADLRFLSISLATFKEETPGETKKHDELMRLIELSILQQIFYKEADEKIPDSRFKRIKSISKKGLWLITCSVILFAISLVHLIFPDLLKEFFDVSWSSGTVMILRYISLLLVLIGGFIFIYKSIRTIQSVKIDKLNIHSAEIKINEKVDKSILNHHLDEILYFFEVAKYNVVIIEDLDRFQQTEIFTKLREINLLINNSEKIDDNVVFIYAVRDDMFTGSNERTKFFDFIIPVIPVINPSNSSEKLLEKKLANSFRISESLIDNISLFVDDMRLLHNIFNEYYLYHQKLNTRLDQDKLLSMVVYKNLFPDDFVKLTNNRGTLFDALNSRLKYIETVNNKIDLEIQQYKNQISTLEHLVIKDVKELRYMYLFFYASQLPGFVSFKIANTNKTPSQMTEDENFDHLIKGTARYVLNEYYRNGENKAINLAFSEVERLVDESFSYSERVQQIEDFRNGKINELKQKMSRLEGQKLTNRSLKISELLAQAKIEIPITEKKEETKEKQAKLLNVLLRNGYINEDYLDYVSIFYEGSISKNDHQFLINVKCNLSSDFDFKLDKISNLIKKIDPLDFEKAFALNFKLLDFLLSEREYQSTLDHVLVKLADDSALSFTFINQYIDRSTVLSRFIEVLSKKWKNFWKAIESNPTLTDERKEEYFKLMMLYTAIEDFSEMKTNYPLIKRMEQHPDILSLFGSEERARLIIETMQLKLRNLNFHNSPNELLKFVYNGSYYGLNLHMVRSFYQRSSKEDATQFDTRNYYAISQLGGNILAYVDANINIYIPNVYLKIPDNVNEEISALITLLNHAKLSRDNKEVIIKHVQTKIDNLENIKEIDTKTLLIRESRITATWKNLIDYYKSNETKFSEEFFTFLEAGTNASNLSKMDLPEDIDGQDDDNKLKDAFAVDLLLSDQISDKTYNILLNAVPWRYTDLAISTLSEEKLLMLVKKDKLQFNAPMFKAIRHDFVNVHIKFIELNYDDFIDIIAECELSSDDIKLLLESNKLTNEEKHQMLKLISEQLYIDIDAIKSILGEIVLQDETFNVSETVLKSILTTSSISIQNRIKVFNRSADHVPFDYYDTFLRSLGEEYAEITIKNKRPLLEDTEHNFKLLEILREKNYISNFDFDKNGIRVYTFRKDD